MHYKALMLDVDGTLIPYDYNALPSKKVIAAVKKAQEKVKVFVVTGRAYNSVKHILEILNITTGAIAVNDGAIVFELPDLQVLYKESIPKKEARKIVSILLGNEIEFYAKDDIYNGIAKNGIQKTSNIEEAYAFYSLENYSHEKVVNIFNMLSQFPNLTLHKTRHDDPDKFGFNITHAKATKLHGIEIIMKKYGLKKEEIIGVGDGYNDFPLLMASGLKVAMGNAIPTLKDAADYVAPSVTENGVAKVIEKFILER